MLTVKFQRSCKPKRAATRTCTKASARVAAKITYLHNAMGQRVFKSEPQVAQTAPNAATLGTPFVTWLQSNFGWMFAAAQANATLGQSYVYDDGQLGSTPMLLGEYGNGGSQTLGRSEYLWLPLDDGTTMPIGLYTTSRLYAVHADHLNTPRQITDDTNKVAWQLPYSAFGDNKPTGVLALAGAVRLKATAPAVTFNLRFAGQYFDEESNLAYNYFRSYQPGQGRYCERTKAGLDGWHCGEVNHHRGRCNPARIRVGRLVATDLIMRLQVNCYLVNSNKVNKPVG